MYTSYFKDLIKQVSKDASEVDLTNLSQIDDIARDLFILAEVSLELLNSLESLTPEGELLKEQLKKGVKYYRDGYKAE